jgi:hypothetical protein
LHGSAMPGFPDDETPRLNGERQAELPMRPPVVKQGMDGPRLQGGSSLLYPAVPAIWQHRVVWRCREKTMPPRAGCPCDRSRLDPAPPSFQVMVDLVVVYSAKIVPEWAINCAIVQWGAGIRSTASIPRCPGALFVVEGG